MPDTLLIFGIPLKSAFQHLLFILDALGDNRDIQQHNDKGNYGTKHHRHGQEQKQRSHIHWMPDDAIEPCVNDFLVLLHLHRAGKPNILSQYLCVQRVGQEKNDR